MFQEVPQPLSAECSNVSNVSNVSNGELLLKSKVLIHIFQEIGTRDKAKQAKQAKGESSEEKNTLPIMSGKSRF
jgi:hypothetical protein